MVENTSSHLELKEKAAESIAGRGLGVRDMAALAVTEAGYRDFRHLAQVYVEKGLYRKSAREAALVLNVQPEVFERLLAFDEFLQEVSWATVYAHAGTPDVMGRVVGRLVQIATEGEDEDSLAAHRIYISLLARMGIFPKNEQKPGALGVQINILSNHPAQQEVVVIDDQTLPQGRSTAG